MALDIESAVDANSARIALAGELDGSTAPKLRETVEKVLSGKPTQLVLQVEKLTFMASAGSAHPYFRQAEAAELENLPGEAERRHRRYAAQDRLLRRCARHRDRARLEGEARAGEPYGKPASSDISHG